MKKYNFDERIAQQEAQKELYGIKTQAFPAFVIFSILFYVFFNLFL